jgi:hypothetical protein
MPALETGRRARKARFGAIRSRPGGGTYRRRGNWMRSRAAEKTLASPEPYRALQSHGADAEPTFHPLDDCVLQEVGESHADVCDIRRMVQFLPPAHDAGDDAGRCGATRERGVDYGTAVERVGEGVMDDRNQKWWERRFRQDADWPFIAIALSAFALAAILKYLFFPDAPGYVLIAMALGLTVIAALWRLLAFRP